MNTPFFPDCVQNGKWVRDAEIAGSRYHPGTVFRYSAWAPNGLRENAALYLLMEHNPDEMQAIVAGVNISDPLDNV